MIKIKVKENHKWLQKLEIFDRYAEQQWNNLAIV